MTVQLDRPVTVSQRVRRCQRCRTNRIADCSKGCRADDPDDTKSWYDSTEAEPA